MRLNKDGFKEVPIYSERIWNETGIEIHDGDEYLFEASGEWKDLWKKTDADGYSNFYMSLYNKFKRSKNNKWLALIGSLDKTDSFLIGIHNQILFKKKGMLFCFANDILNFYWNNSGFVTLRITRVK